MAEWKRLDYSDMRLYLAKDELDKLQNASIDADLSAVVNDTLDLVAEAFRGAWLAKGYQIDDRDYYVCSTYYPFVLAYARWTLWNRFPNAQGYALTETRKDEWKLAADLLKNPYIGVSKPDPEEPVNPDDPNPLAKDPSITIPWLRCPPLIGECGFPGRYWSTHSLSAF